MPETNPLVSICIPLYNCEGYISETIESVINQTYSDLEIIIIDDKSSDKSYEIAKSYESKDKRIRVIGNETNLGFENNWNKCLNEAKGKYFKLLPSDDIILAETIEKQVQIFENPDNSDIVLVFGRKEIINQNGIKILSLGYSNRNSKINNLKLIKKNIRSGTNKISEPGGVLLRRDILLKVGNFDGSLIFMIDLDYWFRVLLYGNGYYLNEPLSQFRISNTSVSSVIRKKQSIEYITFLNRIFSNSNYNLTKIDIHIGKAKAIFNQYIRNFTYKLLFK